MRTFEIRRLQARLEDRHGYGWGLFLAALLYLLMASAMKLPLTQPSAHDSYTLQALTWRSGHIALPENYDWLELALFEGRYYVSFPPFPTVPMWLLTFIFGAAVPSMLVNFALFLGSYTVGYSLARRLGQADLPAAAWAVFWVAGCNLLEVSLYGGVWNIAQGMGFFLMMLAVCGWQSNSPGWAYAAPIALACAVGCRPFYAVYVPVALWVLWQRESGGGRSLGQALRRMLPRLVAPALIALAYAGYNWVRFGNPLEFGHNYLPEFVEAENGQFALAYVWKNIGNIMRLPYIENAQLGFPIIYGFAFYLANPLFIVATGRAGEALWRRENEGLDWLLLGLAAAQFFLYLLHKSFGAWQFGTRYLIDVLPVLGWYALRRKKPIRFGEGLVMLWAVAFNVYGGVWFHLS